MKPNRPSRNLRQLFATTAALLVLSSRQAVGVEIEAKGKALKALLGTPQVKRKQVKIGPAEREVFYTADKSRIAVVESGLYPPNCTHTWAIGIAKDKISEIRVLEMSCPHAFPTKAASFLDQYRGKGPAQAAKLKGDIHTIAKATGSADLLTDAVLRVLTALPTVKSAL